MPWGIGLNGVRIMTTANTIRMGYGILSIIENMMFLRDYKGISFVSFSDKLIFVKRIKIVKIQMRIYRIYFEKGNKKR